MKSLFESSGWGREQMGFTDDPAVFDIAAAAADITTSAGMSPRAVTAVFFASGAGTGGGDPVYIQHVQFFEAAIAEGVLLDKAIGELSDALATGDGVASKMGIKLVDAAATTKVNTLSAAMKVPPPPTTQWAGAVVALHVANVLNVLSIRWGVVRDPARCRYSVNQLVANTYVVVQELQRTEANKGLG